MRAMTVREIIEAVREANSNPQDRLVKKFNEKVVDLLGWLCDARNYLALGDVKNCSDCMEAAQDTFRLLVDTVRTLRETRDPAVAYRVLDRLPSVV